jgi:glycosyltransferase involved in cell wall biosynthesis
MTTLGRIIPSVGQADQVLQRGGIAWAKPRYDRLAGHLAVSDQPRQQLAVFVGGSDLHLRIPFLHLLADSGFCVRAMGSGDRAPFVRAGIDFDRFEYDRFVNPIADRRSVRALSDLIAAHRPSLVQSFDTKPNILAPIAARAVPGTAVVRTINGLGWVYSSRSPAAIALRPSYLLMHHRAGRHSTATVFQNQQDQSFFRRFHLVAPDTDCLIPGSGVDIEGFDQAAAAAPAAQQMRAQLGLGAGPVVLTVTRLTRQKGIPTLLKAAEQLHRIRPDMRFVLVGPRETEGYLAISRQELDRHRPYVVPIGQRDDVPALLRMADVFAFPTEYREGVPRALLEAALAERPIVATRMPGCNDVIEDGRGGYLVPPRSPDALAARILDLVTNPNNAQAMARAAADLVRREFGLKLIVARYTGLYRTLLAAQPNAMSGRGR